MLSSFSTHNESRFLTHVVSSEPAWKSMYILYSGMLLAMSCPSQLRMLPRPGFTLTLSRFSREATSIQYCFLAVMMYIALPMTANPINVINTAIIM